MRILALDLSLTRTGYALDDGRCGVLAPPRGHDRGMARLRWIRDRVLSLATLDRAGMVVLEGYAFGFDRDASRQHALGELGGVVRLALFEAGVPYLDVPPATLKKFATGKGNARKEVMQTEAVVRLGYRGGDNNEVDALWLRVMAKVAYDPEFDVALPVAQLRVVQSLVWPGRADDQPVVLPPRKPRRPVAASAADDLFGDGGR